MLVPLNAGHPPGWQYRTPAWRLRTTHLVSESMCEDTHLLFTLSCTPAQALQVDVTRTESQAWMLAMHMGHAAAYEERQQGGQPCNH